MSADLEVMRMMLRAYLTSPSQIIGALLPLIISLVLLLLLARRRQMPVRTLGFALLCTFATGALSRWHDDGQTVSLYAVAIFPVVAILLVYARIRILPEAVFICTYLGLLLVDIYMAWARFYEEAGMASLSFFFFGIGGGGLIDGLIVRPLMASVCVWYLLQNRMRRGVDMLDFEQATPRDFLGALSRRALLAGARASPA